MIRKFLIALGAAGFSIATLSGCGSSGDNFTGAGATFPAPLYAAWAQSYKSLNGSGLNYQAVGSGGGIRQIKAKTVDFGASDKPLKAEELKAAGLVQFPTVIGGVVPIVNLPGMAAGKLRLSGTVLANIFLGQIKLWNDPQIVELNPQVPLPATPITVVHRADGSGTSFIFTTFLARKSPAWAGKVGASDSVNWPVGLGGKGNDGVAAFVKQTKGAIGYVEYVYARKDTVTYALVQNAAGQYPQPDQASFAAAGASAPWDKTEGNYVLLIDQPGAEAWPISGATFILMHKNPADPARAATVLKFVDWAYKSGDATATKLDYVPMPAAVKDMVRGQWAEITMGGKPVYQSK